MGARAAKGTKLQRSVDGGLNFVTIPGISNIQFGGQSDKADVTDHDTVGDFKKYLSTTKDMTVSGDFNFDPSSALHSLITGIGADWLNGTSRFMRLVLPDDTVLMVWEAKFENLNISFPVGAQMGGSFTLMNANGAPDFDP